MRRRTLLSVRETGFTLDFNALDNPTEDARLILKTNTDSFYMWNFTTQDGLSCFIPPQNSYIALANPCYGSEALEIDGFFPYENGPIVSCGDEIGKNYAPLRFRYDSAGQASYVQYFHEDGQFDSRLTGTAALRTAPVRKRLRVERRGNTISYYANTGPELPEMSLIATVEQVGSAGGSELVNAMAGLKFRTGFAFVSGLVYLNYIKWERL